MTPQQWDRARPHIEAALECARGTHTFEDVKARHERNEVQVWLGGRSVVVTEAHRFPQKTHMHIWLAGGELRELDRLRTGIEAFARGVGCHAVTASPVAKRAMKWAVMAEPAGYQPAWTIFVKELT